MTTGVKGHAIGHEYIVEAVGEEFIDTKLYFVCLLCDATQKHSALPLHLTSSEHHMKFLVSLTPSSDDS
jgi:hypothetical protein